jgi:hypothetical protein
MARLVMVTGILGLTAVLLAGCGGGNDRAKVEASLRDYLGNLTPEYSLFPVGAGSPRVKDNSCWDRHLKVEESFPWWGIQPRSLKGRLALWQCVVKFGTLATPVLVVVDDRIEVVSAMPGGVLKEVKRTASQPSTVGDCPPQGC